MHYGVVAIGLLTIAVAGCAAQKDSPENRQNGTTQIPLAKEPRTVRFKGWSANNSSWGLHNVTISTYRGVEALRSDGSQMISYVVDVRNHWAFGGSSFKVARLNLIPKRKCIFINYTDRTLFERNGIDVHGVVEILNSGSVVEDPQCEKTSSRFFDRIEVGSKRRLGPATYAGISAIGFAASEGQTSLEAYFAPSRACETLSVRYLTTNSFGIPTSIDFKEVVSYRIGEPDPTLFEVPSGYRRTP